MIQGVFPINPNKIVLLPNDKGWKIGQGSTTNAPVPVIITQPQSAVYQMPATATALTVVASVSGSGTLTYQWFRCQMDGTIIDEIIGATNSSFTPFLTNANAISYYRCKITNTDFSVNNNCKTEVLSNFVSIETQGEIVAPVHYIFELSTGLTSISQSGLNSAGASLSYVIVSKDTLGNPVNWEFDQNNISISNGTSFFNDWYIPNLSGSNNSNFSVSAQENLTRSPHSLSFKLVQSNSGKEITFSFSQNEGIIFEVRHSDNSIYPNDTNWAGYVGISSVNNSSNEQEISVLCTEVSSNGAYGGYIHLKFSSSIHGVQRNFKLMTTSGDFSNMISHNNPFNTDINEIIFDLHENLSTLNGRVGIFNLKQNETNCELNVVINQPARNYVLELTPNYIQNINSHCVIQCIINGYAAANFIRMSYIGLSVTEAWNRIADDTVEYYVLSSGIGATFYAYVFGLSNSNRNLYIST